ncbi:sigma-70 family RNA polymerase sigma factor [Candidatus Uhrbacteria bacterium]|nr:sigma-70 family RNA polymerase sigma factor [Candidatus Uhrbacteria bacterium]
MELQKEKFLLFRIRAFQDQRAFELIVEEFGQRIEKFLKLRLSRREDIEDVYAEIWARFWSYAQDATIESISGLVHTIARGAVAEFYRTRERKPEFLLASDERTFDVSVPLHEDIIARVDVDLLKTAMRELKDDDVQLIQMRYLDGYRIKDIAKQLGKSENVVSVTLSRALNKLRKLIREKFGEV